MLVHPPHIDQTTGALYVLTHPKESTVEEWDAAVKACLRGEHGSIGRQMVFVMAERVGMTVPKGW